VNLSVAGVVHQPEIREVLRPAVLLRPHVVDVDLFPIVQSLVANRTAPVLPPGELPPGRPVVTWFLCRRWLQ